MRIPKLVVFIAGLETAFIVFLYLLHNWALANFYLRFSYLRDTSQIWINSFSSGILFFLFSNGIFLLTVGICGFGRRYFKNHQDLFTAVAAILVPSILFTFLYYSLSNLTFGF
jgi:hypothetical protein